MSEVLFDALSLDFEDGKKLFRSQPFAGFGMFEVSLCRQADHKKTGPTVSGRKVLLNELTENCFKQYATREAFCAFQFNYAFLVGRCRGQTDIGFLLIRSD